MAKFDFRDPSRPVEVSFWSYLKSLARIGAHRSLPPGPSLAIATLVSRVRLRIQPQRRRRMERFLRAFLPAGASDRDLRRAVRLSMAIRRLGADTYAPVFRRSREWILRTFRPVGLEHLDAVKRAGRGAIILGTGTGMKAWVAPILRQLGYPLRLMQRKSINAQTLVLLRWEAATSEVLPYPGEEGSGPHLKRLHDLLKEGVWIQHAGQHPGHENAVKGNLLRFEVYSGRSPWLLSRLTGAALIPVVVLLDESFRFRLVVGSPIHVEQSAPSDAAMKAAFQSCLDFIERHVLKVPWNFTRPSYWEELALAR